MCRSCGMADECSISFDGIQGATVHSGVGTGIRERMGLRGCRGLKER